MLEWVGVAQNVFFLVALPFLASLAILVTGGMILIRQVGRVGGPA